MASAESGQLVEGISMQEHLIYVIDDDAHFRRSLHFMLPTVGFNSWPFACAADFLESLPSLKPAPILLDVRMDDIDGVALMRILSGRGIKWPVIIMTGHGNIATAVETIKLGAIEFLEKPFELRLLETSLHSALAQLTSIRVAEEIRRNSQTLFDSLSQREMDVILLLMKGSPNKTAAHELSLSVRTVEMHRSNALRKLKVKSIAEAVRLATDSEIIFEFIDTRHDKDNDISAPADEEIPPVCGPAPAASALPV